MGNMKELFIQMQEAYLQGAYLEQEAIDKLVAEKKQQILAKTIKQFNDRVKDNNVEEFNPDNEKHVEIMQETQQAIKENSYGEDE
tara:strand:- start:161 stop:415 length:255 start_codon:yes stop_codon:yes gene_type:complete